MSRDARIMSIFNMRGIGYGVVFLRKNQLVCPPESGSTLNWNGLRAEPETAFAIASHRPVSQWLPVPAETAPSVSLASCLGIFQYGYQVQWGMRY